MNVQQTGKAPINVLSQDEAVIDEEKRRTLIDPSLQDQSREFSTSVDSRVRKSTVEMKLRRHAEKSILDTDYSMRQNGSKVAQVAQINSAPMALNDVAGVMTKARLNQMTPSQALEILKQGNARFVSGQTQQRDTMYRVKATAQEGQAPFAIIVSCIDSRVNSAQIFDQGVGDLFSSDVAGNVMNKDIVGGLEFASKIVGTKLIMVLAHSDCGAVKGAIDVVKHAGEKRDAENLGNLAQLLYKIAPAINTTPNINGDDRSSNNRKFVDEVAKNNAKRAVKMIYDQSPALHEMAKNGEISIVNAMYHVDTGKVVFEDDEAHAGLI